MSTDPIVAVAGGDECAVMGYNEPSVFDPNPGPTPAPMPPDPIPLPEPTPEPGPEPIPNPVPEGGNDGIIARRSWREDFSRLVIQLPVVARGAGGYFQGRIGHGVVGRTTSAEHSGVLALSGSSGPALLARGKAEAARFEGTTSFAGAVQVSAPMHIEEDLEVGSSVRVGGDVWVGGDIRLAGADLAEGFGCREEAPAGSVLVLTGDDEVELCAQDYDPRVVGVVSGAGRYRPGIVLDRGRTPGRTAIALVGKVLCLVDAREHPVRLGDLLTTSSTVGHAMAARDSTRRSGALLGKAMGSLSSGRGLVPMVVTLG